MRRLILIICILKYKIKKTILSLFFFFHRRPADQRAAVSAVNISFFTSAVALILSRSAALLLIYIIITGIYVYNIYTVYLHGTVAHNSLQTTLDH